MYRPWNKAVGMQRRCSRGRGGLIFCCLGWESVLRWGCGLGMQLGFGILTVG